MTGEFFDRVFSEVAHGRNGGVDMVRRGMDRNIIKKDDQTAIHLFSNPDIPSAAFYNLFDGTILQEMGVNSQHQGHLLFLSKFDIWGRAGLRYIWVEAHQQIRTHHGH